MSSKLSGEVIHALHQQGMSYHKIGEVIAEMEGRRIRYTDGAIGRCYRTWLREQAQRNREASNAGDQAVADPAGNPSPGQ